MATIWSPISNSVPQFSKNAGGAAAADYYLKFYYSGTTQPATMATDSSGQTLLDKCKINSLGYPVNGSDEVFVPHIAHTYKLALYTNATDADNNATGSAAWVVDGLSFSAEASNTSVLVENQTATDQQATFTLSNSYVPGLNNLAIYRNGVRITNTSYTEVDVNTVRIDAPSVNAIEAGDIFTFVVNENRFSPEVGASTVREELTATSNGQTVFNLNIGYVPGANNLSVYRNGAKIPLSAYVETDANTVTFTASEATSIVTGDEFEFIVNERDVSTSTTPASNVTYTPAGTGAVVTDVQTKLRETVSVKDFGAVGDGVTDDTAAIQAALDSGESSIYFPAGRYVTNPIVCDAGVSIIGEAPQDYYSYTAGDYFGTSLLVAGTAGNACLSFQPRSGVTFLKGGVIRDITIINTGSASISEVINTGGVLVRSFENVHAESSVANTTGCGWRVVPYNNGGTFSGGHYTKFSGCFSQSANCADALILASITGYEGANSVQFFGGRFVGRSRSLKIESSISDGLNNIPFFGTVFEASYNTSMDIVFKPAGGGETPGLENTDYYFATFIQLEWADDIAFHGCRFEMGGLPANYDDGSNGTHTISGGVACESAGTVRRVTFNGCGWYSAWLYDPEFAAAGYPFTNQYHRFPNKGTPHGQMSRNSSQSIAQNTNVEVQFTTSDFMSMCYNSGNGIKVPTAGFYQINATALLTGEAIKYVEMRVLVNGLTIYNGPYTTNSGVSNRYTPCVSISRNLAAGDVVSIAVYHNGTGAWTLENFRNNLDVTKVIG